MYFMTSMRSMAIKELDGAAWSCDPSDLAPHEDVELVCERVVELDYLRAFLRGLWLGYLD